MTPEQATKGSPLVAGLGLLPLPKYFALMPAPGVTAASAVASLDQRGLLARTARDTTATPTRATDPKAAAPGNYRTTHVGDDSDTSPYPDKTLNGHFDRGVHPQYERADSRD